MKSLFIPFFAALIALPLHAEGMHSNSSHGSAMSGNAMHDSAPMSDGVVRKVDTSAGKITIKHGPLANLGMPPMTMVFKAKSPDLLGKVKAGDTVKFHAEDIGGVYTVTAIEKSQ